MNLLPKLAAQTLKEIAAQKKVIPGIFLAIHTFGRDLKRNFHIHAATTCGGISFDNKRWRKVYFHHESLKNKWKYFVLQLLKQLYAQNQLKFSKSMEYLTDPRNFQEWINVFYSKKWVVHLSKSTTNHKQNIAYLGKYLKRPPLSEANIINYDGKIVILRHLDHHTKKYITITLSVDDFIARFISHIPDHGFRSIRYYGWLANRVRTKMLKIVYKLLNINSQECDNGKKTSWLKQIIKEFGVNPLKCKKCNKFLYFLGVNFTSRLKEFIANHSFLAANSLYSKKI